MTRGYVRSARAHRRPIHDVAPAASALPSLAPRGLLAPRNVGSDIEWFDTDRTWNADARELATASAELSRRVEAVSGASRPRRPDLKRGRGGLPHPAQERGAFGRSRRPLQQPMSGDPGRRGQDSLARVAADPELHADIQSPEHLEHGVAHVTGDHDRRPVLLHETSNPGVMAALRGVVVKAIPADVELVSASHRASHHLRNGDAAGAAPARIDVSRRRHRHAQDHRNLRLARSHPGPAAWALCGKIATRDLVEGIEPLTRERSSPEARGVAATQREHAAYATSGRSRGSLPASTTRPLRGDFRLSTTSVRTTAGRSTSAARDPRRSACRRPGLAPCPTRTRR